MHTLSQRRSFRHVGFYKNHKRWLEAERAVALAAGGLSVSQSQRHARDQAEGRALSGRSTPVAPRENCQVGSGQQGHADVDRRNIVGLA